MPVGRLNPRRGAATPNRAITRRRAHRSVSTNDPARAPICARECVRAVGRHPRGRSRGLRAADRQPRLLFQCRWTKVTRCRPTSDRQRTDALGVAGAAVGQRVSRHPARHHHRRSLGAGSAAFARAGKRPGHSASERLERTPWVPGSSPTNRGPCQERHMAMRCSTPRGHPTGIQIPRRRWSMPTTSRSLPRFSKTTARLAPAFCSNSARYVT